MSVVAWDGQNLAADTFCCYGNLVRNETKIWQLNEAIWFGGIGSLAAAIAVSGWLKGGVKPDKPECFTGLIVRRDKKGFITVSVIEETLIEVPVSSYPFAIGSGKDMAMGAMLAGKSAKEAIELIAPYHSDLATPVESFYVHER